MRDDVFGVDLMDYNKQHHNLIGIPLSFLLHTASHLTPKEIVLLNHNDTFLCTYKHTHTRNQVTHLLVVFHAVFLTYTFQLFHTFHSHVSCFLFVCTYLTPLFLPILCTCKRARTHTLPYRCESEIYQTYV